MLSMTCVFTFKSPKDENSYVCMIWFYGQILFTQTIMNNFRVGKGTCFSWRAIANCLENWPFALSRNSYPYNSITLFKFCWLHQPVYSPSPMPIKAVKPDGGGGGGDGFLPLTPKPTTSMPFVAEYRWWKEDRENRPVLWIRNGITRIRIHS